MSSGFGPPDPQHPDYGPGPAAGHPSSATGYRDAAFRPGEAAGSNRAGHIALAAGIAVVVVGLVRQIIAYTLPMSGFDLSTFRLFNIVGAVVTVAIALVALITGGVGLRAPGKPKGAAGAGFALGAWAALSALFGLVVPFILGTGF